MRYRHRALVHPDLVAIGVIAVVVCVECESNRLVGDGADLGYDLICSAGEVGVDHENVVFEDDPTIVAVALAGQIAFVEIDVLGDVIHLANLNRIGPRFAEDLRLCACTEECRALDDKLTPRDALTHCPLQTGFHHRDTEIAPRSNGTTPLTSAAFAARAG